MSDVAEICTRGGIQGEGNSVSKIYGKNEFLQKLHVTKVCTFFRFLPNFDLILLYEEGQNRKNQIMHPTKFSHWAIQILLNQDPISSQFFRKSTITFCSILAIFGQKEERGHTLKCRNQNWFTLLQSHNSWACFCAKSVVPALPRFFSYFNPLFQVWLLF